MLWDDHNAFPSTLWPVLDNAIVPLLQAGDDTDLLWLRWHHSITVLSDGLGETVMLRPWQGDRQGESGAAQRFCAISGSKLGNVVCNHARCG